MGLLATADFDNLVTYCEEGWARWVMANDDIQRNGIKQMGAMGGDVRNPSVQVARDAAMLMLRLSQEFGFTPSARSRIHLPESEDQADAQALLS